MKCADPIKITEKEIENLCFEGGGIRGVSFVGVYKRLGELGLLPQLRRFIGSSAGAIFAAGGACRLTPEQMEHFVENTDFPKFKDAFLGHLGEGYNALTRWGLYKGDYFHNWCTQIFESTIGDGQITFAEVYHRFNSELVITTTDLTTGNVVYLNRENTPHMPICNAIRRSMSIPVFFAPIVIKEDDGLDHVYVDGGCTNNFPLGYFDTAPGSAPKKTIGFNLYESEDFNRIGNIIDIVTSLITNNLYEIEKLQLHPNDDSRIVYIPTFGISSTNFDISEEERDKLQDAGYESTKEFFINLEKEK